jgi:glycosyltransferase involved in cell wall biosynthesis
MNDPGSTWERQLATGIQALLAAPADEGIIRVAVLTDGASAVRGLANTLAHLGDRGIGGLEIDLTDASSRLAVAQELTRWHYNLVHVCAPNQAGIAATLIARVLGVPIVGSYNAEQSAPVHTAFYRQCRIVLSPRRCDDAALGRIGIGADRIVRWEPGVDLRRFSPARYDPAALSSAQSIPQTCSFNVLYAGGLERDHGTDLLAEAFLIARDRNPSLHLVLVGCGPERPTLQARLGSAATFLGPLAGDTLARVYATADLFVVPSGTDACGQAILEAQASGLPVLAVNGAVSAELIESGRSGCLAPPDPQALASALRSLARRTAMRDRLATGGLFAARDRSLERSLAQLAIGYDRALRHAPDERLAAAADLTEVSRAA